MQKLNDTSYKTFYFRIINAFLTHNDYVHYFLCIFSADIRRKKHEENCYSQCEVSVSSKEKAERESMSKRKCRARDMANKATLELTPQSPQSHEQPSDYEDVNEDPGPFVYSTPTHSHKQTLLKVKEAKKNKTNEEAEHS